MAHAQKPDFVFRRKGRVHLNRRGRQFNHLLSAEVCASAVVMLDKPRSEGVWEYWLPIPFASFPFTSPPVRHHVPSGFKRTLPRTDISFMSPLQLWMVEQFQLELWNIIRPFCANLIPENCQSSPSTMWLTLLNTQRERLQAAVSGWTELHVVLECRLLVEHTCKLKTVIQRYTLSIFNVNKGMSICHMKICFSF
jgi:hypothetical protein